MPRSRTYIHSPHKPPCEGSSGNAEGRAVAAKDVDGLLQEALALHPVAAKTHKSHTPSFAAITRSANSETHALDQRFRFENGDSGEIYLMALRSCGMATVAASAPVRALGSALSASECWSSCPRMAPRVCECELVRPRAHPSPTQVRAALGRKDQRECTT